MHVPNRLSAFGQMVRTGYEVPESVGLLLERSEEEAVVGDVAAKIRSSDSIAAAASAIETGLLSDSFEDPAVVCYASCMHWRVCRAISNSSLVGTTSTSTRLPSTWIARGP